MENSRNWAQQISPYIEVSSHRLGLELENLLRFRYGVRICPDSEHLGGLSGCTYSEGASWGKFIPVEDGGRYAEVLADATIAWPLITKAVMERVLINRAHNFDHRIGFMLNYQKTLRRSLLPPY